MATPLKAKPHKGNPPTPPCQGGKKKQNHLGPAAGVAFFHIPHLPGRRSFLPP